MPTKFKSFEVYLKPDPRFQNRLVAKFVNSLMWDGKKSMAQRLFYDALELIKKKVPGVDPVEVFTKAIENVKPRIEVRSRRVGGATYQVPMEVTPKRQLSLAIRWIVGFTRKRKGKPMAVKLADELAGAFKNEGESIKKREELHKMAEANKAFAHFAW